MKSTHCFPKMSLGTYTIVQKIVNSLTNVSFSPKKIKAFLEKKFKHNIRQRVENDVVKGRNACMEKGFNVQNSLSEFNTRSKWDSTSGNAQDRQPVLNLILGNGKHRTARRKWQKNILRERERWEKDIFAM